jgi:hypothetical protein
VIRPNAQLFRLLALLAVLGALAAVGAGWSWDGIALG